MGIAFLLNEKVAGWKIFRSIYFLPTAISWVVIGMVSMRFFAQEGLLNALLKGFGLGFIKTDFLSSEKGALFAVSITFIWSMVGTNSIIFLTGMATLDQSLNEAARMDGAGNFRIFRSITLPQLNRFIQFSFIITVISAFTALFSLIFVMTGGGPGFGTTTLEFFIFQSAFSRGNFGTGAMLGVILFFMMAAGVFIAMLMAAGGVRRVAVLADMLELGVAGDVEHETIGFYLHQKEVDIFSPGSRLFLFCCNKVIYFDSASSPKKE